MLEISKFYQKLSSPDKEHFYLSVNSFLRESRAVSCFPDDRQSSVSPPLTFTHRHQLLHPYTAGLYCTVDVLWQRSVRLTISWTQECDRMDSYLWCKLSRKTWSHGDDSALMFQRLSELRTSVIRTRTTIRGDSHLIQQSTEKSTPECIFIKMFSDSNRNCTLS